MKSLLIILAITLLTTSAFARDDRDNRGDRRDGRSGSISLNDGTNILRINIGNDSESDSRLMSKRIANLERAVRELQDRVYQLEDDSTSVTREVTIYTCLLPTSFNGTFIGKADTRSEARAEAVNKCLKGGGFPCNDNKISTCEASKEIQKF